MLHLIDLNYLHEEIFCLMKHEMAEICRDFKQFRKVIKMARSFLLLAVWGLLKVVTLKLERAVEFQKDFELLLVHNIHNFFQYLDGKGCHSML